MMDLSFWPGRSWNFCKSGYVSILVMMDLSFWLLAQEATLYSDRLVSILVMMDLSFWLYIWCSITNMDWFQSLLWWICLFDQEIFSQQTIMVPYWVSILVMMDLSFWPSCCLFDNTFYIGFNPCYDGFVFLTSFSFAALMPIGKFQSLLWWICLFDYSVPAWVSLASWFQSLLWWICLFDANKNFYKNHKKSFNPCYDGFVFLTLYVVGVIM